MIFESRAEKLIQDHTFRDLSGRSYEFYTTEFSGSLVAKSNRFSNAFSGLFDQIALTLLPGLAVVIGVVVSAFSQNIILGFVFLLWSLIHLYLTFSLVGNKIKLTQDTAAQQSLVTAQLSDFLTNSLTVLSFGNKDYEINNFYNKTLEFKKARDIEWHYLIRLFLILAASVNILTVSTIGFSLFLFINGSISVGTIVLIFSYTSILFSTMFAISRGIDRGTKNLADATEMVDIFEKEIHITNHPSATTLQVTSGAITFNQTTFNYTGQGSDEIDNLDLVIAPGESIGLVGHSGAGKSTIVKLLLRFVDVTDGSIKIDNQDIRDVTQESLRQNIAYVPQEPLLFHRSLRDNIAYGKPDANLDEVIQAAKQANAHEFIKNLEHGYDTLVGERGVKLSGGQRQRVAIARAILKDAPILILDEATSSLDSKSEREIQTAIANLIQGKTVIAIAHRLSTIKHLDRIIVLENGSIAQQGSHDELIAQGGIYADLWEHQYGGFLE